MYGCAGLTTCLKGRIIKRDRFGQMSSSSSTSLGKILANSKEQVTINEDVLSIAEVSVSPFAFIDTIRVMNFQQLWRDDQPACYDTLEELELLEHPKGAHIIVKIRSVSLPAIRSHSIRGLHVFRLTPVDPSIAGVREHDHYCWRPEESSKDEYKPSMMVFSGEAMIIQAWYGPRFGGDRVEHFVVVEFEGDVFLKSKVGEMTLTD